MLCKSCKQNKNEKYFPYDKSSGSYRKYCKSCRNAKIRQDRQNNPEKFRKYDRQRYANNKEKISNQRKKYYSRNKKKVLSRRKKYVENNKEQVYESNRRWREENKKYVKKKMAEYVKIRRKNDIQFKISISLRQRINKAMNGNYKSGSAIRDLGCAIPYLKLHLEKKFQPGMTWDNYGRDGWHIDHIIPLANFDLTDREQIKQACHYTNLQPLWAKDNIIKGDKIWP